MSEITYFDCKYCHEGFRMDGVARCCEAALDVDALVAELNETRGCRGDPRDQSRIAQLEAALRDIENRCRWPDNHTPEHIQELVVKALGITSETFAEPEIGIGSHCFLCNNVHDLMSACPPKKIEGKP